MPAVPSPLSPPLSEIFAAASAAIAAVIGGNNLDRSLAFVTPALRPAVQEIAYGTLRQYGRGDALLASLLAKPLADANIRALLLAAIYRLEVRPTDAHTIVDQAVTAAGAMLGGRFKSLVNAVLRNFQRRHAELGQAALRDESVRWQHPQWWIDKLRHTYPEHWQSILATGNGRSPMTLRLNRRRDIDASVYLDKLSSLGIGAHVLDDHAITLTQPISVSQLPGFFAGDVSVQDWGAQQAARLLDLGDDMRVLDACAAPGGKTAHMLELADVELVALDMDSRRLARVAENLDRLGLQATLLTADCAELDTWCHDKDAFDRVLADVPCSASGVVRRHPDAKWLRRKTDLAKFARMQARILDALWQVLAPGGKMLYSTCSVFEEENRLQVDAFVLRHADARRLTAASHPASHTQSDSDCQLLPNDEHDGFYYALIQKDA